MTVFKNRRTYPANDGIVASKMCFAILAAKYLI